MKKKLRKFFGEKVRALRKAKGLTQEKLGERAGLHYTYIGSIERADSNLSMDNIEKIAKGLKVEPAELFSFSSRTISVSKQDRILLELIEALRKRDEGTLRHVLKIVTEVLQAKDEK